MSDDPKLDFYLENRALIEEWAALQEAAATVLDRALLAAARRPAEEEGVPEARVTEGRGSGQNVRLDVTTDPMPDVWLELTWEGRKLLKGSEGWPHLVIVMDPKHPRPVRDAVKNATGSARDAHGMIHGMYGSWLRYGKIPPQSEPIEIEEYAVYCVQRLREAWHDLHAAIREAVEKAAARS